MKTGVEFVYNEAPKPNFESYLVESVKSMRECVECKILDNLFILNDGSIDNSKEIILNLIKNYEDIYLIDSKKNLGKLKIFSYGLKVINEIIPFQDEDVIFTLDSDMKDFRGLYIWEMYEVLKEEKKNMVVAHYYNGERILCCSDLKYSGTRAIKSSLIRGFWDKRSSDFDFLKYFLNYDSANKGYCLEQILNLLSRRNNKTSQKDYSSIQLDLHLRKAGKGFYNKVEIKEGLRFYEEVLKKLEDSD
jgi:hypothetical protein